LFDIAGGGNFSAKLAARRGFARRGDVIVAALRLGQSFM
jgi:hypothetical protein